MLTSQDCDSCYLALTYLTLGDTIRAGSPTSALRDGVEDGAEREWREADTAIPAEGNEQLSQGPTLDGDSDARSERRRCGRNEVDVWLYHVYRL